MKVFKFGGASVKDAEGVKNVSLVLESEGFENCLLVVSAMGKTTNALEKIAEAYFENRQADALQLFEQLKSNHLEVVKYLLVHNWKAA